MKKNGFLFLILVVFISCNSNSNNSRITTNNNYIQQGDRIAQLTFDTLRNTLLKSIAQNGYIGAMKFCNVQALSISSIYAKNNIKVNRVSDKNRNPQNSLSDIDEAVWKKFITSTNKTSLQSQLVVEEKEIHYYKPIFIQPICLNCHGKPEKDISKELLPVIDSLYKNDKAYGYALGELRGMWHIVFTQ
ncbi:MAG: Tll0287-like domain-containing protein [Ferruginibacter sp.]